MTRPTLVFAALLALACDRGPSPLPCPDDCPDALSARAAVCLDARGERTRTRWVEQDACRQFDHGTRTLAEDNRDRIETLEAEVAALRADVEALEGRLDTLRQDFERALVQIGSLVAAVDKLQRDFRNHVDRLDALAAELAALGTDVTALQADIEAFRALDVRVDLVAALENGVAGDDCYVSMADGDVCHVTFYAAVTPAGTPGRWMVGFRGSAAEPALTTSSADYRITVTNTPPNTTVTAVFCLTDVGGVVCGSESFTTGGS